MKIFVGKHQKTAVLEPIELPSRQEFYNNFIATIYPGKKGGPYITTAQKVALTKGPTHRGGEVKTHYHRNDASHLESWGIAIDGDKCTQSDKYCIPPIVVANTMNKLGYNYILFTTASHTPDTPKWRLFVFCEITKKVKESHKLTVYSFQYEELMRNGCQDFIPAVESETLCQEWFLPIKPFDHYDYECYCKFDGEDFKPVTKPSKFSVAPSSAMANKQKITEIVDAIVAGDSPLHATIGKYIYGAIRDGMPPATITASLHGMTSSYDLTDSRLRTRKDDIDRRVEAAYQKFKKLNYPVYQPIKGEKAKLRIYTRYPLQGGVMEALVQACMNFMPYPERALAVSTCHGLISTFCGRVHYAEGNVGIVLTSLLVGESGNGKNAVKNFISMALNCAGILKNNIPIQDIKSKYLGHSSHTSQKNIVSELLEKTPLCVVCSESGHAGQAGGDRSAVRAAELSLAVECGPMGSYIPQKQNRTKAEESNGHEPMPTLQQPAFTSLKECTPRVQMKLDIENNSDEDGLEGRRIHPIMNPHLPFANKNPITCLPDSLCHLMAQLHKMAQKQTRQNILKPHNDWVVCKFEDPKYVSDYQDKWRVLGNQASDNGDQLSLTFYRRLYVKVVAWAARLAICENPINPVITNEQINIAIKSLEEDNAALAMQYGSGEFDSDWSAYLNKVDELFTKNLITDKTLVATCGKEMLSRKGMPLPTLVNRLARSKVAKALQSKDNFHQALRGHLVGRGYDILTKEQCQQMFGRNREVVILSS